MLASPPLLVEIHLSGPRNHVHHPLAHVPALRLLAHVPALHPLAYAPALHHSLAYAPALHLQAHVPAYLLHQAHATALLHRMFLPALALGLPPVLTVVTILADLLSTLLPLLSPL